MKVPGLRSDYEKVGGIVYFGRMIDKIRLKAAGRLPKGYFTGTDDPTHFDSRCTKFLRISYDAVVSRTLEGGTDDEILDWCLSNGSRPSAEEIEVWNAFAEKRGWRDVASEELSIQKEKSGFADRDDIQTWFDLHRAEEQESESKPS